MCIMYAISTHTPLAGRDERIGNQEKALEISTHTPLAGRDFIPVKILKR